MLAARVPAQAIAASTLVLAWFTVLAGNVVFYNRCEVDCGDGGARGLFFLLVLLVPGAVLGGWRLLRGPLSDRGRLLAKATGALYGLVALWLAWALFLDPLWFFGVPVPLAVVAAAAWLVGRSPG